MSTTTNWTVIGMTCDHCAASVREEITEIAGVESVDVDVASGAVAVTSAGPVERAAVEAAVVEAGYALG